MIYLKKGDMVRICRDGKVIDNAEVEMVEKAGPVITGVCLKNRNGSTCTLNYEPVSGKWVLDSSMGALVAPWARRINYVDLFLSDELVCTPRSADPD